MLHVLNGDATATALAATDVPGERLVWRDLAMEGPVVAVGAPPSAERTGYLAANFGVDAEGYVRSMEDQTARLATGRTHEEIVLWFEQDLFCAVTLWSLLDWLRRELPTASLSLVYPPLDQKMTGLGALPPDRLTALFAARYPLSARAGELGAHAWAAYASPDPLATAPLLARESPGLPFVREAFRCHLGRFPSVLNGLNEVESATLAVLHRGPRRFGDVFREVTAQPLLRRHGMGDRQFAACLRRLMPLISIVGATVLTAEIALAPPGVQVEAGELDWLDLHPIDVWLGGVHLRPGGLLWRWDADQGRLVASAT